MSINASTKFPFEYWVSKIEEGIKWDEQMHEPISCTAAAAIDFVEKYRETGQTRCCEAIVSTNDLSASHYQDLCTRPATGWRTDGPDGEIVPPWPVCEIHGLIK